MTNYGIALQIGGLQPAADWDGTNVVALDQVTIDWGRESAYDDAEPATARMDLIDRDGTWFTSATRIGEPVTITRTGGTAVPVVRGQITDLEAERRYLTNPQNDREEAVWVVHLTIQDKLGMAGGIVPHGNMGADSYEGDGGWGESGPTGRMNQLVTYGGLTALFTGGHTFPAVDPILPSNVNTVLHGIKAKDAPTLLELMQTTCRVRAGNALEYDPVGDSVGRVSLVTGGTVALTRSGNVVSVTASGATSAVSAYDVGTPDGYNLAQTVTDSIDSVTVTGFYYGKDTLNSDGSIEYRETSNDASVIAGSSTRNVTVDAQIMSYDPSLFTAGSKDAANRGRVWLASALVALARRLNGWMQYPALEFDQRRRPIRDSVADLLYRTTVPAMALYFAGSVFTGLPNVPNQVQIIGGSLVYREGGWSLRPNLIPAGGQPSGALTNTQLFGASTATWAMFSNDVTWADFDAVTQGLTS